MTRRGTANIKDTLDGHDATQALARVLTIGNPDLCGVTEWDGALVRLRGYEMARAKGGGPPLVYDPARYTLRRSRTSVLVRAANVGRLRGRKSRLPAGKATVYVLSETGTTTRTVVIVFHLTAEVQHGKGYRTDRGHRARVVRHRAERVALGALVRYHLARGRDVAAVGDTNYAGMQLPPLVSCWDDRPGGSLGSRPVDVIYTRSKTKRLQVIPTASDHDAVIAED